MVKIRAFYPERILIENKAGKEGITIDTDGDVVLLIPIKDLILAITGGKEEIEGA